DARVARAYGERPGLGGRKTGLEAAVDEQAPDLLVRDLADEVLDVHAAVAQRAAGLVGLGDLGGEGDDAFQARLDVGRINSRAHDFKSTVRSHVHRRVVRADVPPRRRARRARPQRGAVIARARAGVAR